MSIGFILSIKGFYTVNNKYIFSGRLAEELRTEQEHGMASDKNLKILSSQSLELQRWFSVTTFDYNGAKKSHDLLKIQGLSLAEILFVKKIPLQDLLSSLNSVISTNERH